MTLAEMLKADAAADYEESVPFEPTKLVDIDDDDDDVLVDDDDTEKALTIGDLFKSEFKEELHPRDDDGKFGSGGGTAVLDKPKAKPKKTDGKARSPIPAQKIEAGFKLQHRLGKTIPSLHNVFAHHATAEHWNEAAEKAPGYVDMGYAQHPVTGEVVSGPGEYVREHYPEHVRAISTARWESLLKDPHDVWQHGESAEEKKAVALHNRAVIASADSALGRVVRDIEKEIEGKGNRSPQARGAARALHAKVYYDRARAKMADSRLISRVTNPESSAHEHTFSHENAVRYLMRTRPLAAAIATTEPKSMAEAFALAQSDEHTKGRQYTHHEVANEYLLWKHGAYVQNSALDADGYGSFPGLHSAHTYMENDGQMGAHVKLSPDQYVKLDEELSDCYGEMLRGTEPCAMAFREPLPKAKFGGYARPDHHEMVCNMTRDLQGGEDNGGYHPFAKKKWSRNTLIHEMAHAATKGSLAPEMRRFNGWMRKVIKQAGVSGENGSPVGQFTTKLGESDVYHPSIRELITDHGANSNNETRKMTESAAKLQFQHGYNYSHEKTGDFQEDWAITIADVLLNYRPGTHELTAHHDADGVTRTSTLVRGNSGRHAPRIETVRALETIFGVKAKCPNEFLEHDHFYQSMRGAGARRHLNALTKEFLDGLKP